MFDGEILIMTCSTIIMFIISAECFVLAEAIRMLMFHTRDDSKPKWEMAACTGLILILINGTFLILSGDTNDRYAGPTADPHLSILFFVPAAFITWMVVHSCLEVYRLCTDPSQQQDK